MTTSPSRWSDEQLMAWADGELMAAEASALEAAIERDAVLARRAATLQQTRALVQEAFAARAAEDPVPAALRAAVDDLVVRDRARRSVGQRRIPVAVQAEAVQAEATQAWAAQAWAGARRAIRRWFEGRGLTMAVTASLACGVVGFLIGQAGMQAGAGPGSMPASIETESAPMTAAAPAVAEQRRAEAGDPDRARPAPAELAASPAPSVPPARSAPSAPSLPSAPSSLSARPIPDTARAPVARTSSASAIAVGELASPGLARLLDHQASGSDGRLGDASFTMEASFRDREGRLCRVLAVGSAGRPDVDLVACREAASVWRIAHATVAGGRDLGQQVLPRRQGPAVQAFLDSIGAAGPLDREAERAALRSGARP